MTRGSRRLKAALEKRQQRNSKYTARQLAAELGIGETGLSKLLAGERKPSLALANILKAELGIATEDWVDEAKAS